IVSSAETEPSLRFVCNQLVGGSHGRTVFVAGDALEVVDFCLGVELQIQPQLWDREISFFPHPSTQASIFLAYEYLHRCSSGISVHLFDSFDSSLNTPKSKGLKICILLPFSSLDTPKNKGLNIWIPLSYSRMWRPKLIGSTDQLAAFSVSWLTKKTDAIQASVKEIDYDFVAPKIKAGSIYEITHFHIGRNKPSHKLYRTLHNFL
ncbi:receptor like protein 19, partial [Prunus dulcis]